MNKKSPQKTHTGFITLEFLIAVMAKVFLVAALVAIISTSLHHYRKKVNTTQLDDALVKVMVGMTQEIRQAGYWPNAYQDLALKQNNNPFTAQETDIQTGMNGRCILFTYDANKDGVLPDVNAADEDEHFGYRLHDSAVQFRPNGANFTCTAPVLEWKSITDNHLITITALNFKINATKLDVGSDKNAKKMGLIIRTVDVTLTGQLTNDPTVSKTLKQQIRIRNDKFVP